MEKHPDIVQIRAGQGDRQYLRDLWRFRELFYFLAWRDIAVRYKQTVIGVAWAVLRPFLTMVILTLVFGTLAKLPSHGTPYPLLVFAGMLPWQFFASALADSGSSLVGNAPLISKIYFPRLILPTSAILVSLIDFLVSCVILLGLMGWYGIVPTWRFLALPVFVLLAFATAMGAGLWFSSLTVKYRDFRFVVPFLIQFGLYVSPVGYLTSLVPDRWRLFYSINPMVGVIDGFRWALLGESHAINAAGCAMSVLAAGALLATGFQYFRRTERFFADLI